MNAEKHLLLALSTVTLTQKTYDAMRGGNGYPGLVVYPKDDYGLFVAIDFDDLDDDSIPYDLLGCIDLAYKMDADWLMFDRDVPAVDERQMKLDLVFDDDPAK